VKGANFLSCAIKILHIQKIAGREIMNQRVSKRTSDKNGDPPYVDEHHHDSVIWDDRTARYVCTVCGLVLQGVPPRNPSPSQETHRLSPNEIQNAKARCDREVLERGSIFGDQDLAKLSPQMRALYTRLYQVHLHTIAAYRQDLRKSLFDRFYRRLLKYNAFREAFPTGPKMKQLLNTFSKAMEAYTKRNGREALQNSTKIRIFLALIEPELDSKGFKAILRIAEVSEEELYEIKKHVFEFGSNYQAVNEKKKEDFIAKAKDMIMEAAIDPVIRAEALDILSKRAQFGGLVIRKRPNVLAAAAIYVSGILHPTKEISRNKARKAVNASYLPSDAINDCKKVLRVKQEDFVRTASQKSLLTALKKRDKLLQSRRQLLSKLTTEAERAFPGIKRILKIRNRSSLRFLKNYPSTKAIISLTHDEIAQFLIKQSRSQLKNVNHIATRLLTVAQKLEMVGRRPRPGNLLQLHSLIDEFERVEQERLILERQMREALGEEGKCLLQTPRIGLVTASIMIVSRSPQTASHILKHQSFFERSLKMALQSLKRNIVIKQRYQAWSEQKKPQLEILKQMTETLIQSVSSPLPM